MFETGNTIIQNYLPSPSITWFDWIKILATPIVTLVTIFITFKNFKRAMLDNLDSKSEWRKTLFRIAGKEKINIEDVQQLRAALRYTEKESPKSNFDKMNVIMIKYCRLMIHQYEKTPNIYRYTLNSQETIRVFCRYLLKDHWEKNQILYFTKWRYKDKELYEYTLKEFLKLNDKDNTVDTDLNNLFKNAKKLIEDKSNTQ